MRARSQLFWPDLEDEAAARQALLRGFWAVMISLALALGYGLVQTLWLSGSGQERVCAYFLYGLECSYPARTPEEALASLVVAFYDCGLTLLLAAGIYQASRFVTLVAFFMTLFYGLITLPAQLSGLAIVTLPALLFLWQAVRGAFWLARQREAESKAGTCAGGV